MSGFSWLIEWPQYLPALLPGLAVAVLLTLIACGIGYPIGFLLALLTETRSRVARWIALVVVEVGRGLPVLVLLYLIYQGMPQVGVVLDAFPAAAVAFTWSGAAYSAEMIRGSIAAVPRGQMEAATALSLSRTDMYRFVVIPQAARISLPPLVNLTITMFHATSLAAVITVAEVMHAAYFLGSVTFQYMSVYTAAAFLYAVIAIPGALLAGALEQRLGVGSSRARTTPRRKRLTAAPHRSDPPEDAVHVAPPSHPPAMTGAQK